MWVVRILKKQDRQTLSEASIIDVLHFKKLENAFLASSDRSSEVFDKIPEDIRWILGEPNIMHGSEYEKNGFVRVDDFVFKYNYGINVCIGKPYYIDKCRG